MTLMVQILKYNIAKSEPWLVVYSMTPVKIFFKVKLQHRNHCLQLTLKCLPELTLLGDVSMALYACDSVQGSIYLLGLSSYIVY